MNYRIKLFVGLVVVFILLFEWFEICMMDNIGIDFDFINFFEVILFRIDEIFLIFIGIFVNVDFMLREGEIKMVDNIVFVGVGLWFKFVGYLYIVVGYFGL